MPDISQFKDSAEPFLPGLLAYFNLADAARRNCHLGYRVVDADIEEFDAKLAASATVAKRIGGDSWLALYGTQSLTLIESLLKSVHVEQELLVGWRAVGEKEGNRKSVERTFNATIIRAVRCLYGLVESSEEIEQIAHELIKEYWGLPVSVAIALPDSKHYERELWICVSDYPSEKPFCPYCQCREFDWIDGDSSVYSGYGKCKTCAAMVDITGIDQLI